MLYSLQERLLRVPSDHPSHSGGLSHDYVGCVEWDPGKGPAPAQYPWVGLTLASAAPVPRSLQSGHSTHQGSAHPRSWTRACHDGRAWELLSSYGEDLGEGWPSVQIHKMRQDYAPPRGRVRLLGSSGAPCMGGVGHLFCSIRIRRVSGFVRTASASRLK